MKNKILIAFLLCSCATMAQITPSNFTKIVAGSGITAVLSGRTYTVSATGGGGAGWSTALNEGEGLQLGHSDSIDLDFYSAGHNYMTLKNDGDLIINATDYNLTPSLNIPYEGEGSSIANVNGERLRVTNSSGNTYYGRMALQVTGDVNYEVNVAGTGNLTLNANSVMVPSNTFISGSLTYSNEQPIEILNGANTSSQTFVIDSTTWNDSLSVGKGWSVLNSRFESGSDHVTFSVRCNSLNKLSKTQMELLANANLSFVYLPITGGFRIICNSVSTGLVPAGKEIHLTYLITEVND